MAEDKAKTGAGPDARPGEEAPDPVEPPTEEPTEEELRRASDALDAEGPDER